MINVVTLIDSIENIPGIGEKRLSALNDLGIFNIEDLLTYYPRRYEDMSVQIPSTSIDGQKVAFRGNVVSIPSFRFFGAHKSILTFKMKINLDVISVTFFNQPWLKNQIETNKELIIFGVYNKNKQELNGQKILNDAANTLQGYYPVSKDIQQKTLIQIIQNAYALYKNDIVNIIPENIAKTFNILPRQKIIENLHFPKTMLDSSNARKSATFEEFFLFQIRLQILKYSDKTNFGRSISINTKIVNDFIKTLPYKLTSAQQKVINEIITDVKAPIHMNRLLQGDVGSGKTVVAASVIFGVIEAGYQAAVMAPTEILARQHAYNISKLYADAGQNIRVELLTSSVKKSIRNQILEDLVNGKIDLLIGTHSLIQKDVLWYKLGIAVIDEQHRFGVKQRAILREQGENPDILSMTATPIPRTLAITAYGEMDVSTINELPSGRKKIKTYRASFNELEQIYSWVHQLILQGNKAYVVTPLIEESDSLDIQNAEMAFEEIKNSFPDIKIGLLHGKVPSEEKNKILTDFKNGKIDLLVSTTVVEVGVDNPNATIIIILDADRFGLSQLHQLRGRVGRNDKQSYTVLVADPKTEYGVQRLNALVASTDGFELAQKDLELRGPGDVIGIKQSGVPDFAVGNPIKDAQIMEDAQQSAIELVNTKNWEDNKINKELVKYLSETMQRYKDFD
ncbi:MAG: ATP-dependent DNA helicase RecG [Lactobacillaceae bacterium]|jgi:ATP-dependent DNA helicase RecG|nr:ATP-dependent DNA helicase RecG [Lactobacillaceae bacterium]